MTYFFLGHGVIEYLTVTLLNVCFAVEGATDRIVTRKSRYRYDDCAMRPICECAENCKSADDCARISTL